MHFIDPYAITNDVLPALIPASVICLISATSIGLALGGILSIGRRPATPRILGAWIGALITHFTLGTWLRLYWPDRAFFLNHWIDLVWVDWKVTVGVALPGAIVGSLIFPKLSHRSRWRFSLRGFVIAYLIFLMLMIGITIAPLPQFLKAAREQAPLVGTLVGHSNDVTSLVFSSDGKRLISGGRDNAIRIWQLETGKLVKTLRGDCEVTSLALSPDEQFLVSAGSAGVTVRQLDTGKIIRQLEIADKTRYPDKVIINQRHQVAAKGIGKLRFVGVFSDSGINIWQADTGEQLQRIDPEPEDEFQQFTDVIFNSDKETIITSSNNTSGDDKIRVYRLDTGERTASFAGTQFRNIARLAISADGKLLAGVERTGRYIDPINLIWIWQMTTGQLLHTLKGEGTNAIAISPGGNSLVAGGDSLQVWQVSTGKLLADWNLQAVTRSRRRNWITAMAISPDNRIVATADDKVIRLWYLNSIDHSS